MYGAVPATNVEGDAAIVPEGGSDVSKPETIEPKLMQGSDHSLLVTKGNANVHGHIASAAEAEHREESMLDVARELVPVLVLSLAGLALAGEVLSEVQAWSAFHDMPDLLVLAPVLLGAKDNVVMPMASRLTTLAAVGQFDDLRVSWRIVRTEMAVVQAQAVAVGLLSALLVLLVDAIPGGDPVPDKIGIVALCAVAMLAVAVMGVVVGAMAIGTVLSCQKLKWNPDNVATPIIASLGDVISLSMLSYVGEIVNDMRRAGNFSFLSALLVIMLAWMAWCAHTYLQGEHTSNCNLLVDGGAAILLSMTISFISGLFLDRGVQQYADLALLLPVMNGMSGNLACVYACRLCTAVQTQGGSVESTHSLAGLTLILSIPVGIVFLSAVSFLHLGEPDVQVTLKVVYDYLFASTVQVLLLIVFIKSLVTMCYSRGIDADNYATPLTTSTSDALGSALLFALFSLTHEGEGVYHPEASGIAAGIVPAPSTETVDGAEAVVGLPAQLPSLLRRRLLSLSLR